MNNNKRPAFHLVVDGVNLSTVYGWKNLRAELKRHTDAGRVVSYHH